MYKLCNFKHSDSEIQWRFCYTASFKVSMFLMSVGTLYAGFGGFLHQREKLAEFLKFSV